MGVVFRGFDPAIGRHVAVKIINIREFGNDLEAAEARLRFQREAAAAGKLSHPNIVTIHHLGEDGDRQYLVMELISGDSLDRMLAAGRPLAPDSAVPLLVQIADALDYAHSQGIVHRDIKPANVLVRADGQAKITDFGIARISSQTMTKSGMTMGTPAYMAPEQIMSARVNGKADQFSLAVMAYQMICGRMPFVAESHPALMYKIVSEDPIPAHTVNSNLPARASEILRRALDKEPEKRLATCSEFVRLLADTLAAPAVQLRETSNSTVRPRPTDRSRPITLAIAVCLILLLVLVALSIRRRILDHSAATPLVTPVEQGRGPTPTPASNGQTSDLEGVRAAAQSGNVAAMEQVAAMYAEGRGVAQNYGEAIGWYRQAADAGSGSAMNNLGWIYDQGKGVPADYGEAMKWYVRAADAGQSAAMFNIGTLYEGGKGVSKDPAEAIKWYQKAAAAGVAAANQALQRLGQPAR